MYIDLTYPIRNGMMTYPSYWHPMVEVSILGRHELEGRETRRLTIGTHTGTHVDAPCHFIENGKSIEDIPLGVLIGPAYVLNFENCPSNKEITLSDLKDQIGGQKNIERILFRYDWSENWGKKTYYTDYPYLSHEVCEYLIDLKVKLIGMDTPSPDNPKNGANSDNDSPNHKILLRNNVVIVEYLCNLKKIKKKEIQLIVLPLKVKEGDGAPARCVAIEE